MPADILATGTNTTPSSDFTVAANESRTIGLKGTSAPNIPNGARVHVFAKDEVGSYWRWATLTPENPALVLSAGTWRVARASGSAQCGVFRD